MNIRNIIISILVVLVSGQLAYGCGGGGGDNQAPVSILAAVPETVILGEEVVLNGSSSYDPGGSITKCEWDYNYDGTFIPDYNETPGDK
ncbi:MAG: hypothetical protein PHP01_09365, partial [Phycisphaerae bacterium]|nr:hypothetical protein [Phycisphaerae bacterium]